MRQLLDVSVLALALAARLEAQGESELKRFFEGRMVSAKIDLPATQEGVDLYPDESTPLDFGNTVAEADSTRINASIKAIDAFFRDLPEFVGLPKYAGRLKKAGTAVRSGESIMVTKVKVKDKHIEFQLGGSGYGTFGDQLGDGGVSSSSAGKTEREKNLDRDIDREKDPAMKRRLKEERDELRKEREREDASNRATVAAAQQAHKADVRGRAHEAGSRFNVRYKVKVGAGQLTPQSVMQALDKYLDFPADQFETSLSGDN